MSDRYKGAILSPTAPTVIPQSAGGVYTLSQQLQYQGQGVWPPAISYPVNNSLRFRSSASAYLNRTPASAGNRKTWTWSGWVKRGTLGVSQYFFSGGTGGGDTTQTGINFLADNKLNWLGGSGTQYRTTTQVFRDPSAWYHIVLAFDTTLATANDRIKIYVNGTQITAFDNLTNPTQNVDYGVNQAQAHNIGRWTGASGYFDGYLAEVNFIDGTALTPSSFGTTDAYGIWQPIPYTGAYGTNGFYLPFTDNSALTTSSNVGLGKDFSGNGNYWVTNNISITAGSTYDSMKDVPTNTNSNTANYAVLSPLTGSSVTPTPINGNLTISTTTIGQFYGQVYGFRSLQTKFYFEVQQQQGATGTAYFVGARLGDLGAIPFYAADGSVGGVSGSAGATYTNNDVIGVALDPINATIEFFKNGISQGGLRTITGGAGEYYPFISVSDSGTRVLCHCNFGQQPFAYTPPSGFYPLNTYNLPTPTILAGNQYMDATLFTGTGANATITNSGSMQPDFVWGKSRSNAFNHILMDSVRGTGVTLFSNSTSADYAVTDAVTSFNSNGFSYGVDPTCNTNGSTNVFWQWRASNAAGVSNTQGTITSTVSANTTAGFSIVTYTGNATSGATVGHGLGVAPAFYIVKQRTASSATSWYCYHSSIDATPQNYAIYLNLTNAKDPSSLFWNNTAPTSSVFSLGTSSGVNGSSGTYVAYCFSAVAGYSAFGSYTGNGSSDGPFVYTGFRPRYVLIKDTTNTNDWFVMDTARGTYNTIVNYLNPNKSLAEQTDLVGFDILSNGFKVRQAGALNNNNANLIYMAFAENPFKIARGR